MESRYILFSFLLLLIPCLTWAQKKELSQARTYIKSGKDFDKAEKLMTDLLKKDSASRQNKKVYLMWYEAVDKQHEAANERLYLKQKQDTAAFFDLTRRMFTILEHLDSIDMRPDKKGRVAPEYRERHAAILDGHRANLYNGGIYFVRKMDYQKAFDYFESYIDCDRQPLFTGRNYLQNDPRMPEAAYWATYSAYMQKDAVLTLRHRELALRDTAKAPYTIMYIAEARKWLKDTELYTEALEEGFRRFPTFHYFFPRLMDEYYRTASWDKALWAADTALTVQDSSELFLFAKSTTLLKMERYRECIETSDRLIALNDTLSEAYFNAGTSYLQLTNELDERKDKKQLKALYQHAQTYMERYRRLMPAEKQKWAPALYRIYLNLNMGRQFDEIDRILQNKR
jgi:tetratricopeptide (TPR) repeat protein